MVNQTLVALLVGLATVCAVGLVFWGVSSHLVAADPNDWPEDFSDVGAPLPFTGTLKMLGLVLICSLVALFVAWLMKLCDDTARFDPPI